MNRKLNTYRTMIQSAVVAGFALVLFLAWILVPGGHGTKEAGRVLSGDELAIIFGDAPGDDPMTSPCKSPKNCRDRFVTGGTQCSYCDSTGFRDMCCLSGKKGSGCNYTGLPACADADRYIGLMSGSPGTCASCTGSLAKDGKCQNMQQASGDGC